jgi:hypothetical protein
MPIFTQSIAQLDLKKKDLINFREMDIGNYRAIGNLVKIKYQPYE